MEEKFSKTEALTVKVTEVSGTNVSNIMDTVIEEEEEEEGTIFQEWKKTGSMFGANKEWKMYGGILSWKTKCFTL